MRKISWIAVLGIIMGQAAANAGGLVTPTEVTITFTQISLVKAKDGKQLLLMNGSFPHTFKKSDTDFAGAAFAGYNAPAGRYAGVNICYHSDRQVKIDGETYNGSGGTLADSAKIWTTGTSLATASNVIATTAPGTGSTTLDGYTIGTDGECSLSSFTAPVCVSENTSHCLAGDILVNPTVTPPHLNMILDLYQSVGIDPSKMSLDPHVANYPYATIGAPGAAVHLKGGSAGAYGHISLIFSGTKQLLYSASYGTGSVAGFCSGVGAVTATAGPTVNAYGPTWVQKFDATTGVASFAAGGCSSGSSCSSGGVVVVTPNVANTLTIANAQPFNVTCTADSSGGLGFSYAGGPGNAGTTAFTAVKVIDPGNIFAGGCQSGCGAYP